MKSEEPKLYRLIDANLNRLREGLRTLEDIQRYIYDNKVLAKRLKELRHLVRYTDKNLLLYRDIKKDVLKQTTPSEAERKSVEELIIANIKRAQEAARVLEEAFKLFDPAMAQRFKQIRYELYDIEKEL